MGRLTNNMYINGFWHMWKKHFVVLPSLPWTRILHK
jgi:hypothetical protein